MKNLFKVILAGFGLLLAGTVSATSIFNPQSLGAGTPTAGYVLTASGTSSYAQWLSAGATSMTWPASAGVPYYSGSSSWGSPLTATGTAPLTLTLSTNSLTGSIAQCTSTTSGWLSSIDWNTFNNKLSGETDPVFQAWLSGFPNISIFTNNSGYLNAASASLLYLGISATASDSLLLQGHNASYFQPSGSYLTGVTATTPLSGSGTASVPLIFTNPGYITNSQTSLSSLNTVGTIGTGTWNATAIGVQYGGTGRNWLGTATGSMPLFTATGTMGLISDATSGYLFTAGGANLNPSWTNYAGSTAITTLGTIGAGTWQGASITSSYLGDLSGLYSIKQGNTSLVTLGTVGTGTWNATNIGVGYGGTGQSWTGSATGSLPYFSGTGTMGLLSAATSTYVLTANGANTAPSWQAASGGGANTALSNLSGVAINTSLLASTTNSIDLGSSNYQFNKLYLATGTNGVYIGNVRSLSRYKADNIFVGTAGNSTLTGTENTFVGDLAGAGDTSGNYNTFLGYAAGNADTSGASNVFLGIYAGEFETGTSNLFIVDNQGRSGPSDSTGSLMYGTFSATPSAQSLTINGTLSVAQNLTLSGTGNALGTITSGTWHGASITSSYIGDLSGSYDTVTSLKSLQYGGTGQNWLGSATGSLPYFSGTGTMGLLGDTTSGYLLMAGGANLAPSWQNYTGSTGIITLGTITAGTWHGASITSSYLSGVVTSAGISGANGIGVSGSPVTGAATISLSLGAITPTSVNGLTLATATTGFTISGGTTAETLTVNASGTAALLASTQTMSFTRITKRVVSVSYNTAPTYTLDNGDIFQFFTLSGGISNMSTNETYTTKNDGEMFEFEFMDNGTGRQITWGANFSNSGNVNCPASTTAGILQRVLIQYNAASTTLNCIATD